MGSFRFLLFYLLCGVIATLAQIYANFSSTIPSLGASGAIAGVLAAYLRLFPRAKIAVLVPIFILNLNRKTGWNAKGQLGFHPELL